MFLIKLKIVAALLGVSSSAMRLEMVSRRKANEYSVIGQGVLITRGCTQSAERMTVELDFTRGKPFVVFYDEHGEEEASCELVGVK